MGVGVTVLNDGSEKVRIWQFEIRKRDWYVRFKPFNDISMNSEQWRKAGGRLICFSQWYQKQQTDQGGRDMIISVIW